MRALMILTAALTIGSTAYAQTSGGTPGQGIAGTSEQEFVITGFLGSSFGDQAEEASPDFGGAFSWLFNRAIGAEFIASFAPSFRLENATALEDVNVNSYMFNAIAALPFGT